MKIQDLKGYAEHQSPTLYIKVYFLAAILKNVLFWYYKHVLVDVLSKNLIFMI